MDKEIKEILQDMIDDIYQCGEYIGQAKKLEKVLDYITNLQQRKDKAVEYIENNTYFKDNAVKTMIFKDYSNNLLNILKGDDTNE